MNCSTSPELAACRSTYMLDDIDRATIIIYSNRIYSDSSPDTAPLQVLTLSAQGSHNWLPGGAVSPFFPLALCQSSRLHLLPITIHHGMHHACTGVQR